MVGQVGHHQRVAGRLIGACRVRLLKEELLLKKVAVVGYVPHQLLVFLFLGVVSLPGCHHHGQI